MMKSVLRAKAKELVAAIYQAEHPSPTFQPGVTRIPYAGRCFGAEELQALVDVSLDFWLTLGERSEEFEQRLADYVGTEYCVFVNSGSSAMLLAFAALMSPLLSSPLTPGSEVLTTAVAFPTTVNPILQHGCVPVFVDVELDTANVDVSQLEAAVSSRTRAVVLAHTLGNPFAVDAVMDFCRRHQLYLLEDNCDALGSTCRGRRTGGFGHLAAGSFFPAHHITTGEGGCVFTDDPVLCRAVRSLRDWGRDCHCPPGRDNCCGRRFSQQHGSLPYGYDHKYVYTHLGYNLRPLELQAAIGLVQIERLPGFIEARKRNHALLREAAATVPWLRMQAASPEADPAWFAALLRLTPEAPVCRNEVVRFLEERRIQTRLLFGGNLMRQPAYRDKNYRVAGELPATDALLERSFFIGVWPGYGEDMLAYLVDSIAALGRLPAAGS